MQTGMYSATDNIGLMINELNPVLIISTFYDFKMSTGTSSAHNQKPYTIVF